MYIYICIKFSYVVSYFIICFTTFHTISFMFTAKERVHLA